MIQRNKSEKKTNIKKIKKNKFKIICYECKLTEHYKRNGKKK